MPNHLVTGLPGAGKTLYAVSELLRPMVGAEVAAGGGVKLRRRLCVAGVRDLLLAHEPVTAVVFNQETGLCTAHGDSFKPDEEDRLPGEAPHDCERRSDNWWRWCMPGDVIVIDECQDLFRPMASGRRAPKFVTLLERHRHYGVDFVFITQHPQLVHTNVRNLINLHNHVRRVLGGHTTIIYEWDHCHNPNSIKDASAKVWRHQKDAYSLYKSAEVHTKLKHRVPMVVYALGLALLALPAAAYYAKGRIWRDRMESASVSPAGVAAALPAASVVAPGHPVPARPLGFVDVPDLAGCWAVGDDCKCMDRSARLVRVALPMCRSSAASYEGLVPWAPRPAVDGKGYGAAASVAEPAAPSVPTL